MASAAGGAGAPSAVGDAATVTAGAGSLWNANSWHWESRNYNKWGEESVRAAVLAVTASDSSAVVKVTEVKDLKVEASINIRKGKKIPVFDISYTAVWEARQTTPPAPSADGGAAAPPTNLLATGELRVHELMPDEIDDFDVRVSVNAAISKEAAVVGRVRDLVKGPGGKAVRAAMKAWHKALLEHDGGQEKLALDAARRAEEAAKTAAARVETSAEKERIAAEQEAREAVRKEEEKRKADAAKAEKEAAAARAAAAAAAAASAAASAAAAPTADVSAESATAAAPSADDKEKKRAAVVEGGSGSVWNKGNYHWEEKPMTAWAKEHLSSLVKGYNIDLPGGHVKIVNVELTGEASASIRKGKKIMFFEWKVKALWEGQLLDEEGTVLGAGDGEINIPDLDQDNCGLADDGSDADYEVKVSMSEDGGAKDKQLRDLLQKHGMRDFKSKIATFVKDLKARG